MELRHLQYFVAVAEELHFRRAAERLQISQQPLSAQIRRLEEELGVVLFHRTTRQVELTEAGRIFLEKARETLRLAAEAIDAAREADRGERGRITVGYISTTLYNVFPSLVRDFRETYPHIDIVLRELCSPELDELVMRGDLDIGITGRSIQDNGLDYLTLYREPFVVVLPINHPLASLPEIPLHKLANEPFIIYDRTQKRIVHDEIVSFFHRADVPLNVVQEVTTEQALVGLAAAGMGTAIVSASVAKSRESDVVFRPLVEPSVDVEFSVIWRCESPSTVVRSFIQVARRHAFAALPELPLTQ